jgi:nucleoside-diphosphate-sugar epimerase
MTGTDWRDAKVLVTGARGFIGSRLSERLATAGAVVHGVSSRAQDGSRSDIEWWKADLADRDAVRHLVSRVSPDVVFHLAGHVTGSQSVEQVQQTFELNLASTVHLLTAATGARRTRVVLTGSMQEPVEADGTPPSPYAASKWACGAYARMFHALYQLPVTTARPMMVYGPGQWDVTKLLPFVVLSLLNGQPPSVSSGNRELDWVFVDDVVDGLMIVARADGIDGRTVDLGSGTLTTIRDFIEQLVAVVETDVPVRFGAIPDRPLERPRAARTEETRRLIGWQATTSLDEGLRQTVAWYRQRLPQLKA